MAGGGIPRLLACDTIRLARGFQQRFREKVRPARSVPRLFREKTRPAQPLQRCFREKTRPASVKTPILRCFERAGRTFSRSCPPSDRAGRTFSRTGSCDVATLKPPSPMLAPKQQPLKPPSPLQPKNAPKTAFSHPQRRCRFHLRLGLREQRRRRFHARDFRCTRAMAEPGRSSIRRAEPHISDQAPPVWRAPEGPEGTGGLRDRPLRAAGSRVAISRAAGPDGARNTRGAASNKLNRKFRLRRPRAAAGPEQAHAPQTPPDCRPPRGLRGLAGLRADAPRRRRCGGRRRDRRARAGFEARRRTK